jgi:phosphatidylserine/phosphatidylglycerophosphate/cardiolipin synthase-like enzyme
MNKLLFKLFVWETKKFNFIFILSLLILNGCNITGNLIKEKTLQEMIPKETNLDPIILFCPEDDCEKNLIALINHSKSFVHCAFYDLRLENVIKILGSKSSDVDIRIVMEKNNYKEQIKGNIRLDNNKYYMHNKFCVIDNKVVWTGSFNPTIRGAYHNNNNVVVLYSSYLVENYEGEFNELWDENFTVTKVKYPIIYLNNKKIENYFCPEDDCAQHIIDIINKAKNSIYFMTFSFTNGNIADAILFKDKNISIKGIFEATQAGSEYSQYKRLKDFGLDVIKDKNKASMHHKIFIIDNETVITGSFNPTVSGDKRNDENILIIHDKEIAGKYLQEFEKVWNLG